MLQPCYLFHERCPALGLLRVCVACRMRCAPLGVSLPTLPALPTRQAVPLLIELMKDAVPQVKDTAAWCMCRICELHTPSISDDNKMQVVMNVLVQGLADHAKVARWCVGALNVLTEHFANEAEVRCRCLHGSAPLSGSLTWALLSATATRRDAVRSGLVQPMRFGALEVPRVVTARVARCTVCAAWCAVR